METKRIVVVHKGAAFAAEGNDRFAKDIVSVGERFHPKTGKTIAFDVARLDRLVYQNTRYLKNGNSIPFPNGHTTDALENLGDWPGPFVRQGDELFGVCHPKDAQALSKVKDGSLDFVSAFIEKDVTDPKGHHYPEVMTHICATNYPVWTGQGDKWVALSREAGGAEFYLPEGLDGANGDGPEDESDPMDLQDAHEELTAEVNKHAKAYKKAKADKGDDHADTKKAAGDLRDATTRLANHAELMRKHVANTTSDYVYPGMSQEPGTVGEALAELRGGDPDPIALATELEELAGKGKASPLVKGGKFVGGFDGCLVHMQNRGYSAESARKICGKIAQQKGG